MGEERIRIIETQDGERIEVTPDTLCNRCLFSGSIIQPACKRCFSGYCWKQYTKDPYVCTVSAGMSFPYGCSGLKGIGILEAATERLLHSQT